MEPDIKRMEAQLERWSLKIEQLAAKAQGVGAVAGFDALIHVDELKALHAIALAKLNEFKAGEDTRRARLKAEMKSAWGDLERALKGRMP